MFKSRKKIFIESLISKGIDARTARFIADVRKAIYEADDATQNSLDSMIEKTNNGQTTTAEISQDYTQQENTTAPTQEAENADDKNPVIATINHYNSTQKLLKTAITDRIIKNFTDAEVPEIKSNGNIIIEKKLYISPKALESFLKNNYKCSDEQVKTLIDIFIKRDFLTITSRLTTSDEKFSGASDTIYYMMLPEVIEKYNS